MNDDYQHIAEAIRCYDTVRKRHPSAEEVAEHVGLSSLQLDRMLKEWAGVGIERFLSYLSVEHIQCVLRNSSATLSPAGVSIERMTEAEYGHKGQGLRLHDAFADSPFGEVLIASTALGVCYLAFTYGEREAALAELKALYPGATLQEQTNEHIACAAKALRMRGEGVPNVRLHLHATTFQLRVWQALLGVGMGQLTTYNRLAKAIGQDKAARAVGSAVAANPVALLIPCHRVIRSSGQLGDYHWTATRKAAIIGWEAAQQEGCLKTGEQHE